MIDYTREDPAIDNISKMVVLSSIEEKPADFLKGQFTPFENTLKVQQIELNKVDDEYVYDMNIGWQLAQKYRDNINGGISVTKTCLGAIVCTSDTCKKVVRPRSKDDLIEKQVDAGCTFCHSDTLKHLACSVRINFKFRYGVGSLKQTQLHEHPIFTPLHETMDAIERFDARATENINETALGLKVGTCAERPQFPGRSVTSISKGFRHLAKVRRYRRTALAKKGLWPSKEASLEGVMNEMRTLNKMFPGYLDAVDAMPGQTCITFRAPGVAVRANLQTHPMLTDVTYDCFTDGYYLCSTNMFFEELGKYGVIFQAVLDGLSSSHFHKYFVRFFKAFDFAIGLTDPEIDANFSGLVMDFSAAQRIGFFSAFKEAFPTSRINPTTLLKGCYHHWRQSVQRVIGNHAVVPLGRQDDFDDLATTMYSAKGNSVYQLAVKQIRAEFPNIEKWLNWWTRDANAPMIFQSQRALKEELQDHPTRTSNGIEAFHRNLYRIINRKKPVIDTLKHIFTYLRDTEADLEQVDGGAKIDYDRKPSRFEFALHYHRMS